MWLSHDEYWLTGGDRDDHRYHHYHHIKKIASSWDHTGEAVDSDGDDYCCFDDVHFSWSLPVGTTIIHIHETAERRHWLKNLWAESPAASIVDFILYS